MTNLRSVVPPATWEVDWGDAHARLEDLKTKLGDGLWARALSRVTDTDTDTDRSMIDHLLAGALDT